MACNNLCLILHISVIILTVSSKHATALSGYPIDLAAQLYVQPLWEIDDNELQPCQLEERNTSGGIVVVHGSALRTCSIYVNTSLGYHARIVLPDYKDREESAFQYIERQGDLIRCPNKYLSINGQTEACTAILLQESFYCNLQGNVSLVVSGISVLESSQYVCPELEDDILSGHRANQTYCKSLKGYHNQISCDLYDDGTCRLVFPTGCSATLDHREAMFHCPDNDFRQTQEALIIYPIYTPVLDLSNNGIIQLQANALNDLTELQELYLQENSLAVLAVDSFQSLVRLTLLQLNYNKLTTLPDRIFQNLKKLSKLYLDFNDLTTLSIDLFLGLEDVHLLSMGGNQLAIIKANTFQGMTNLTVFDLYYNKLTTLPGMLFSELGNLNKLYLEYNYLTTLPGDLFRGLVNLNQMHLEYNELTTLPGDLFQGLGNLNDLFLHSNELTTLPGYLLWDLGNLAHVSLYKNQLDTLNVSTFLGVSKLEHLAIDQNYLVTLNEKAFQGLITLQELSMHDNKLTTLPGMLFRELGNLNKLYLEYNYLTTMPGDLFRGLGNLNQLNLEYNELTTLPGDLFWDLGNLAQVSFFENQLDTLNVSTFLGVSKLEHLAIHDNNIMTLPGGLFWGLNQLGSLSIDQNYLITLNEKAFQGLITLQELSMHDNKLTTLPSGLFDGLENLQLLTLYRNQLVTLHDQLFNTLKNLVNVFISSNKLITLSGSVFNGLNNLEVLDLPNNLLEQLGTGVFRGLFYVHILSLANNKLSKLENGIFRDLINVTFIDLSYNMLKECPIFKHLSKLSYLNLRQNTLTGITHGTFSALHRDSVLLVSQHEICNCYVPVGVDCSAGDKRSPYLTCDRLLSDKVLVILMWLIGINALGGNIFVLVWRKKKTQKYKVQDILLSNLAMSDSFMGIYMLMVACADIYYGEYFPMQSEIWRSGIICRIAGSLSIASSEASVFFVTMISIDRFNSIKFPYSVRRLGKCSTIISSILIWICSLLLGIIPSIFAGGNFKFYDNSHVCIGLPLALTKTYSTNQTITWVKTRNTDFERPQSTFTTEFTGLVNGLYYSSALFLGVNGICYLLILGCYVEIVRTVTKSAKQSGRTPDMNEQIKLTRKVTAIVATDFLCWSPVILLGFLVQTRVIALPPSVFAWLVTFVLPVNSAINPYLYTIAEIISNYQKKRQTKPTQ